MSEITSEILKSAMPSLLQEECEEYAPLLTQSMVEFEINNQRRVSAYLANLAHESNNLTHWEENLNYSMQRLMQVWPSRFPFTGSTVGFDHNPEALANKVYGGRMGNNEPGDGWKYRGRFPLQMTGKSLYAKASEALNIPELLTDPDSCMQDPSTGFRVSAWIFAKEKNCNQLADKQFLKEMTKTINGGYNGLAERIALYNKIMGIIPSDFSL